MNVKTFYYLYKIKGGERAFSVQLFGDELSIFKKGMSVGEQEVLFKGTRNVL